MPASEEEITDHKKNVLKELFGNMISSHVDGHKSLDSLQSIKIDQFDQNRITAEIDSKVLIQVIDNKENYERSQDEAETKYYFQQAVKTDSGKSSFKDNFKITQQNMNDIKNLHIQKGSSCSEINKLNNGSMNEKNMLSSSRSDEDELTFVKEAYVCHGISAADVARHENSVDSSRVDFQNKKSDKEADSDNSQEHEVERTYIQEKGSCDTIEVGENDKETQTDLLKGSDDDDDDDEAKYMTDIRESEKKDIIDGKSKDVHLEAVDEKQDVEKVEKYMEMGYAEKQHCLQMLYSEILSEFMPQQQSVPSSFPTPVVDVTSYSIFDSFESALPYEKSRLWPDSINYPHNIFASRQTNMISFSISDEISQTADLLRQHENILFHADKKRCNLNVFSNSGDWNIFKASILQKCESKVFCEMDHLNHGGCQETEGRYNDLNGFINEDDGHTDVSSCGTVISDLLECDLEEFMDPECLQNDKSLEKEERDEHCEDLIVQNSDDSLGKLLDEEHNLCEELWDFEYRFDKQTDDDILKVTGESQDTEESFSMLTDNSFWKEQNVGEKTVKNFENTKYLENNSGYFQEDDKAAFEGLIGPEVVLELNKVNEDNLEGNIVEDSKRNNYSWKREQKNKLQKLKKPGFNKSKGRKQRSQGYDNKGSSLFLDRNGPLNVKSGKREEIEPAKHNRYEGRREDSCKKFHLKDKCTQPLFSMVKNASTRKINDEHRKNINCNQQFPRKSKRRMSKQFQYKINQGKKPGTETVERHVECKWDKPRAKKLGSKQAHCFQKPIAVLKGQPIWQMKPFKGYDLYLSGSPPIRLHLVEARVNTRSGNGKSKSGSYSSSGTGSADGNQGNGNDSAQRGNGSGRQSGSGSGSGGNGNNNNNNAGYSGKDAKEKSNAVQKKSKDKKTGKKTVRPYSPENQNSPPSLPTPKLDPIHIAERHAVERARPYYNDTSPGRLSPALAVASLQEEGGAHDLAEGASDGNNSFCEEEEEVSFQHAAMSIEQLCDVIGKSTRSCPSGSDAFSTLNICLTRIVHDLSLAADDSEGAPFDNCSVCLVLSQLLIHMADPGHDGCVRSCDQCSQIFHLIMEHCIGCIINARPKSRITQSDLCYKICKFSQWNVEQLCQNSNKLMGKVQKYCDKVLGNTLDMVPNIQLKGAGAEGIGEIAEMYTDDPSTGVSSTATLSLGGNIVTSETGEQDQRPPPPHIDHLYSHGNLPFVNSIGGLSVGSSSVLSVTGADSDGHAKLSRKPSHPRKTPAIPQPIPEDSQPESNGASEDGAVGRTDDTEAIIYQRMFGQSDPYETQRIYGTQHRYVSLQEGNVHDVEQFWSESNQAVGTPGIGEVVFSHPPQLKIVAGFWDRKREECERTHTCPYQHREEGVILAEYKECFGILCTRYQKHHQWERVSHLGNGMSGKCHLAIDLKTNFKFCCKKIHLLRYTEEELTLWSEMKNPYVVKLYGAIRHGVKIYIFSEFIDGGSLAACIEEQKYLGRRLSHWSAINYFQQLLKVLAFLQKKNILHEDIKADNILLRRNSTYLAVTDFGTSRRLQDPKELKNKSPVGSPTHWSPEKASMEGHGFPSDLWAAVCVLVHMLSGEPPWVKRFLHKVAILNFIIFQRSPPMEDVPSNIQLVVRDLIAKGFIKDPQARPSSSELLQHPAFKILDEGTPETYFSTLTSMAHGFPVIQAAGGGAEQQGARKEVPMFSAADSTAADATVLYTGTVSTGPYQESDSRPDNINRKPSERIPEVINSNENVRTGNQQQSEEDRNETNGIVQSEGDKGVIRDEGQAASVETQNERRNIPSIVSSATMENHESVVTYNVNSKVRQLVGPLNIDNLLPQFNELFVSSDSLSTQSIKSFFVDDYNTEEFNGAKRSPLERYKPEVKQDVLPNLSIFDWEAAPASRQQESVSERENFITDISQISALPGTTNPPIRSGLQGRRAPNPINFMLSSESDECTSADLFEPEPAARSSDSGQYGSNNTDVIAETSGSETQRPSLNPPEDMSPTASTGSSSNTSTLQMRKPINLTLHCTPLPPELPHSQSDILLSAPSANGSEMKNRTNTWSQLSSSTIPHHTGSTPSSSQATSTLRRTNGTSIPSTASSGHSQFSYHRSSVKEEQEKRIQELTSDMLTAYSTSSESDTSFLDYHQQEPKYSDVPELEDKPDIDTVFRTMLEEMDETKLGGHNLKFFSDGNRHLFTMHIEELPAYWRNLITSFRHKITHFGYIHFSVNHMNNKPVKYHHPLGAHEFRVVRLQASAEQCWCYLCKPMY